MLDPSPSPDSDVLPSELCPNGNEQRETYWNFKDVLAVLDHQHLYSAPIPRISLLAPASNPLVPTLLCWVMADSYV